MDYTCPVCTVHIDSQTKFCENCGYDIKSGYTETLTCPQCKTVYAADVKFCINDGNRLVREADLLPRCVNCNTVYADDTKFCPEDGGIVQPAYLKDLQFRASAYGLDFYGRAYPKADVGIRLLANLLDGLFFLLLSIPAIIFFVAGLERTSYFSSSSEADSYYLLALLCYIIPMIYAFVKDGLGRGQSWGKKIFSLMVINLGDHTACNKSQSFTRNLISGLIMLIPFIGWLVEPIMILATPDGRKLGDKAADTQVINIQYYK